MIGEEARLYSFYKRLGYSEICKKDVKVGEEGEEEAQHIS